MLRYFNVIQVLILLYQTVLSNMEGRQACTVQYIHIMYIYNYAMAQRQHLKRL